MIKATLLLILAFSTYAFANDFETRVLLDKTYVHDNSYCRLQNKVVEFEVRSFEKYTQPDDAEYGEHIFALQGEKRTLLPLNADNLSRFKLFKGENPLCSKALSLKLDDNVLAVFFLKDNRPLGNLLTVLFYNMKDGTSKVLNTDFTTTRGSLRGGALKFPSLHQNRESEMGKITINDLTYIYRDAEVIDWVTFDGSTFQLDRNLTYEKFDWKNFFSKEEFEKVAGYDSKTNQFQQKRYIVAINHLLKRRCLAFTNLPVAKIPNQEWRCR